MNWPKYLVWDVHQSNFIKRTVSNKPQIDIVGPIWNQDSNITIDLPNSIPAIAVFDVQPVRSSFYQKLALYPEYYIPANAIARARMDGSAESGRCGVGVVGTATA